MILKPQTPFTVQGKYHFGYPCIKYLKENLGLKLKAKSPNILQKGPYIKWKFHGFPTNP